MSSLVVGIVATIVIVFLIALFLPVIVARRIISDEYVWLSMLHYQTWKSSLTLAQEARKKGAKCVVSIIYSDLTHLLDEDLIEEKIVEGSDLDFPRYEYRLTSSGTRKKDTLHQGIRQRGRLILSPIITIQAEYL